MMASVFLAARLGAYLILGFLAGLSGALLRQFDSSAFNVWLRLLGGIGIIILGLFILFGKEPFSHPCRKLSQNASTFSSLCAFGFIMGLLPCGPFVAVLLDSTVLSKTGWDGMLYALSFGLGNLIATFFSIAGLSGIMTWLPERIQRSNVITLLFRMIAVLLLMVMGLELILPGVQGIF
jgi:sulfite exporter TauE/SafE